MQLRKNKSRYVFECTYHERKIPKTAGFLWDPEKRHWWTDKAVIANRLIEYATPQAKRSIEEGVRKHIESLSLSRATDANVDIPAPEGLEYLPFQRAGIAYALDRPNTLMADQPGLGKTIQAIGVINGDPSIKTVLVIVPATLKINWQREVKKWLVRPMTIGIASGKDYPNPEPDIVIINYDILKNHRKALRARKWDCLICDESHYLKNAKAQRTKEALGGRGIKPISARRILFLTGTPILNKPIELWTTLKRLDPSTWRSWKHFANRYCDAYYNGFGWDVSGASNLDELQKKLRSTIMVRRLKSEVLKELPPKRRQIIALPADGMMQTIQNEWPAMHNYTGMLENLQVAVELAKTSDNLDEYDDAVQELRNSAGLAFTEMSKARYETAMAKLPIVIEHIKNVLESEDKVVVFAHHLDVLNAIYNRFESNAVILTGETSHEDRQLAVDEFQNNPDIKLFVGSIKAAGVGITLTASSTVLFAELDWVPANMSQAEDRLHRITQTNSVLVQHLVLDGSLDASIAKTLVAKQQVLDKALDAPIEERDDFTMPVVPTDEPTTVSSTKREIAEEAETITQEQIETVHQGLRFLSALDPDKATQANLMGFNAVDGKIGHSLAQQVRLTPKQAVLGRKILRKYHRQLGDEFVERMGVL